MASHDSLSDEREIIFEKLLDYSCSDRELLNSDSNNFSEESDIFPLKKRYLMYYFLRSDSEV